MKRYKDCKLVCLPDQNPMELMQLVMDECRKEGLCVEQSTSISDNDTFCVYVDFVDLPASKLVLNASTDKNGVAILNIVPLPKSDVSMLDIPTYNQILDAFSDKVFCPITNTCGNPIEANTEDYSIDNIIPQSFPKLKTWLSFYPLSHHPLDEHRWYDFLIALLKNGERVASSVLSEYIKENYHWADDDLFDLEMRFESQMDLLEYYEKRR